MTKNQIQEHIDKLYINLEKDIDANVHSSARMVARVANRLLTLGMMLEKYNENKYKNRTLNRIVKESKKWVV